MDRIDAWRLFLLVAETGSFSEAARRSGVSVGQVSKRIAALEGSLTTRLFERTTRAVRLTDEGARYVTRAEALVEAADALAQPPDVEAGLTGTIRMTAPAVYGACALTPAIAAFLKSAPGLSVQLELSDRFADLVEEGLDLALRIHAPSASSLVGRRLRTMALVPCAAPDLLAAHGPPGHPRDLARLPCLIDRNLGQARVWRFTRGEESETVRVDGRFETNGLDALVSACAAGIGIGLLPDFAARTALGEGTVVPILEGWSLPPREIWLLWPPGRFLAPRTRRLADFLIGELADG